MDAQELAAVLADDARDAGVSYSKTREKMRVLADAEGGIDLLAEIAAASLALLVVTAQDLEDLQNDTQAAHEELVEAARVAGYTPPSDVRAQQRSAEAWVTPGPPDVPYRLIP